VLLGAPGSGKGTQCKQLSAALRIPRISSGDLLREYSRCSSAIGQQVKEFIDAGILVSDSLVMNMIEERTKHSDCSRGFILDGFPRNLAQARLLEENLLSTGRPPGLRVLRLIVPEPILLARLSSRLICSGCGTDYNNISKPPRESGICDLDGQLLIERADDLAATARERMRVYEEQLPALIDYYRDRRVLIDLNGNRPVQEVAADFLRAINLPPSLNMQHSAAGITAFEHNEGRLE
jgi:adenylate kinase